MNLIYKLPNWLIEFLTGCKNLIKWFPVIWRDRDWDNSFIYEIIKVKLNNQAGYIGNHNRHQRAKRDAELMRLTSRLIERCQDDYYDSEFMDYHESKVNWLDVEGRVGYRVSSGVNIHAGYQMFYASGLAFSVAQYSTSSDPSDERFYHNGPMILHGILVGCDFRF